MLIVALLCIASTTIALDQMSDQYQEFLWVGKKIPEQIWNDYSVALREHLAALPYTLRTAPNVEVPLTRALPKLQAIGFLDILASPTPLYHWEALSLGNTKIYIKDDGKTAKIPGGFGGNKIRKLQTIMYEAYVGGYNTVITFGGIGSNFALATASIAKHLGMSCHIMLAPHTIYDFTRRNILGDHSFGAHMHFAASWWPMRGMQALALCHEELAATGKLPYLIRTGGSNARGAVGYVNAAFELKEQLEQSGMQVPDYIYVASGSLGTVAGLYIGLRLANLPTKIRGVLVEPNEKLMQEFYALHEELTAFLKRYDPTLVIPQIDEHLISFNTDQTGPDYAVATEQSRNAQAMFSAAGMVLDDVYTAKAAAGLIDDVQNNRIPLNSCIIFWNTFDSGFVPESNASPANFAIKKLLDE